MRLICIFVSKVSKLLGWNPYESYKEHQRITFGNVSWPPTTCLDDLDMDQGVVKYKLACVAFAGDQVHDAIGHGIQNESAVLRHLLIKCEWRLEGIQKSYKKAVGDGVLYGKIDGIRRTTARRLELIEIKSRMAEFKGIQRWEMVQVQLYLYLTGLKTCLFVESCGRRVRCYRIQKNENYIKVVMMELSVMMAYAAEPDDDDRGWTSSDSDI